MKLIRYEYPQSPAASAFNRLFDLGGSSIDRFGSIFDDFFGGTTGFAQPAADLYEDEHNYYARFELPGMKKNEVDLELENSVLTISSVSVEKSDESESRASFQRSISVPDGVDLDAVSAAMKDGVLTVTLPKAEARKPRQITVK
ncbi:Hsp20/alpha crystallin family protein [Coraliomargarita sinensis]|uniref:Hsp20/alpha crystallin family protein n=1 Tax=Coraliomargarita sinensis TaxID=2174842 RepID=A0A317ZH75_9BACT|nr:Hsp20/alpha crystallin family protein [Coraliomargarita sinensis]PXA03583.1 Hsp20/alpha crystallin family protein [Coraliomargarita sinensis]